MTAAKKHPRRNRPKKSDTLMCPGASREEIASDHAMSPFNRAAIASEEVWGIDRLPELVSPETASRFGFAMADLNAAYASNDPAKVVACANNAIKGLAVMDAEARAAGHQPATGDFWEYELEASDGQTAFRFAVMRDSYEWKTAKDKRPDLEFYTMREVANALRAYSGVFPIAEVKANFPGAEITKITPKPRSVEGPNGGGDEFEF